MGLLTEDDKKAFFDAKGLARGETARAIMQARDVSTIVLAQELGLRHKTLEMLLGRSRVLDRLMERRGADADGGSAMGRTKKAGGNSPGNKSERYEVAGHVIDRIKTSHQFDVRAVDLEHPALWLQALLDLPPRAKAQAFRAIAERLAGGMRITFKTMASRLGVSEMEAWSWYKCGRIEDVVFKDAGMSPDLWDHVSIGTLLRLLKADAQQGKDILERAAMTLGGGRGEDLVVVEGNSFPFMREDFLATSDGAHALGILSGLVRLDDDGRTIRINRQPGQPDGFDICKMALGLGVSDEHGASSQIVVRSSDAWRWLDKLGVAQRCRLDRSIKYNGFNKIAPEMRSVLARGLWEVCGSVSLKDNGIGVISFSGGRGIMEAVRSELEGNGLVTHVHGIKSGNRANGTASDKFAIQGNGRVADIITWLYNAPGPRIEGRAALAVRTLDLLQKPRANRAGAAMGVRRKITTPLPVTLKAEMRGVMRHGRNVLLGIADAMAVGSGGSWNMLALTFAGLSGVGEKWGDARGGVCTTKQIQARIREWDVELIQTQSAISLRALGKMGLVLRMGKSNVDASYRLNPRAMGLIEEMERGVDIDVGAWANRLRVAGDEYTRKWLDQEPDKPRARKESAMTHGALADKFVSIIQDRYYPDAKLAFFEGSSSHRQLDEGLLAKLGLPAQSFSGSRPDAILIDEESKTVLVGEVFLSSNKMTQARLAELGHIFQSAMGAGYRMAGCTIFLNETMERVESIGLADGSWTWNPEREQGAPGGAIKAHDAPMMRHIRLDAPLPGR